MMNSRRQFLTGFTRRLAQDVAGAIHGAAESLTEAARASQTQKVEFEAEPFLRPPGALAEAEFIATCDRTGACLKACPYQSIRRLGPEFGEAAGGTPAIIVEESPCYLCPDMPCITACDSGALRPVERRDEVRMGVAQIDYAACYAALSQPCDYCVLRCPLGRDAIDFGEHAIPRINEKACAGCGVCAYLCPPSAIRIDRPVNG